MIDEEIKKFNEKIRNEIKTRKLFDNKLNNLLLNLFFLNNYLRKK